MTPTNSDSAVQNNQATQENPNSDTHQGSNATDPRVNVTDNPEKQQLTDENPVSMQRSRTPSDEATVSNLHNRSHGNRPKVSRQGSEDHD